MNTVELIRYSLDNAFGILGQVTADLTQEQADWMPSGIANPIGATYWHTISGADEIVFGWCGGQAPLYQKDGWQEKVAAFASHIPSPPGAPAKESPANSLVLSEA